MKTTKRILALITAFILCLAPMALMVGAAETETCSHRDRYVSTDSAANAYVIAPATATHCPTIKYVGCVVRCQTCHERVGLETLTYALPHIWDNNRVCRDCGYQG